MPLAALAQGGRADPADASASAPALRYQSAFLGYKPWQDLKPADWRAVNDKVRDAAASSGSHAVHNMTPTPAAPAASAPAPKASAPAMPGHGGHRMHGGKP
ncbi:MAG: hypothetical protein HOQ10_00020 [Frateuria sp.]|nr:hypothetical protein [Frateuria sp.]